MDISLTLHTNEILWAKPLQFPMMKRIAKIDKSVARRWKKLGDIGEAIAESLLAENGFTNIRNLNHEQMNFAYADFYAERNGIKYVISVKARNKYVFSHNEVGEINPRYKLGPKCYEYAARAEERFGAAAAWLTIALDVETYSAYFGLLSSLKNCGVAMTEKATSSYECLARDNPHLLDYASFQNVYEVRERDESSEI